MNNSEKKKPIVETAKTLSKLSPQAWQDEAGKKLYPTIWDVMSARWKEGVMTRQAGRLTIRCDGGTLRATIECPTEGLQTTYVADSLAGLFEGLEAFLASNKARWGLTWQKAKKNLPVLDD